MTALRPEKGKEPSHGPSTLPRKIYFGVADCRQMCRLSDALGYESATSFIIMFKKAFGATPAKYVENNKLAATAIASGMIVELVRQG